MVKFMRCYLFSIAVVMLSSSAALCQYDSNRVLAYLKSTFEQDEDKLYDYLIQELRLFSEQFPRGANAAEAHYLIAKIYEKDGKEREAMAAYFKTMLLYPGSERHSECQQAARQLITSKKEFRDNSAKLIAVIDGQFEGENQSDRYFNYLRFLIDWDESDLYDWTIDDCKTFMVLHGDDQRTPTIIGWVADLYHKDGMNREAVSTYRKLETIYPEHLLLAEAKYKKAVLLSEELDEHIRAIEELTLIADIYPESDFAASSIYLSGKIREKKLKEYQAAISDYQKLVDKYPRSEHAVEALFAIAEVNDSEYGEFTAAITAYDKIVADYPNDDRGVKALKESAKIYKDELKNYVKAAEQFARAAELYPQHEETPELIFEAGEIAEDKLKDYNQAINYYEIVVTRFPNHKKANDAAKKIRKAREKMTEASKGGN